MNKQKMNKTDKNKCITTHQMQLKTIDGVSMVVCCICDYKFPCFPHNTTVALTSSKITL